MTPNELVDLICEYLDVEIDQHMIFARPLTLGNFELLACAIENRARADALRDAASIIKCKLKTKQTKRSTLFEKGYALGLTESLKEVEQMTDWVSEVTEAGR